MRTLFVLDLPVSSLFWWCDRVSIWGPYLYSFTCEFTFLVMRYSQYMRTLFVQLCLWVHFSGDAIESVYEDLIYTALAVSYLFWWWGRVSRWGLHLYSLPVNSLFWWCDRVSISLWGPHLYCFACDALHEIHTDLKLCSSCTHESSKNRFISEIYIND